MTSLTKSEAYKWLSLVGVIWLQSVIGTNANFPLYSSDLKRYLSLSQLHINALAFASDAGKFFAWFGGLAARRVSLWLLLMTGLFLGSISYALQLIFLEEKPNSNSNPPSIRSYLLFFLLSFLAGHGICWITTVSYMLINRNFPADQQFAVGIATSYQGLSPRVYAVFVDEILSTERTTAAICYLFLNSVLPLFAAVLVLLLLARDFKPAVPDPKTINPPERAASFKIKRRRFGFVGMSVITTVTGVYGVVSSVSSKLWHLFRYSGVVFTVGLLLLPLVIPVGVMYLSLRGGKNLEEVKMKDGKLVETTSRGSMKGVGMVKVKEEIGVKEMVKRVEFWLYLFVYLCGPTIGMVYLSNLGQISESRLCYETTSLVSLSSSFTFFGHLIPSFAHYVFSGSKYLPSRPALLVMLMTVMGGSFFLILDKRHTSLYISTALIGISTGAITSITVTITTELFGPKHFGVNHTIVVATIPVGSLCFGYLAALFYEMEKHVDESTCMGESCYKGTFLLWGCLSTFGALLSFVLYYRTREFYSDVCTLKTVDSFSNRSIIKRTEDI
ncbi:Protein NUCLEAR FUSION DEFECTIVE 4 [Linum perenne]